MGGLTQVQEDALGGRMLSFGPSPRGKKGTRRHGVPVRGAWAEEVPTGWLWGLVLGLSDAEELRGHGKVSTLEKTGSPEVMKGARTGGGGRGPRRISCRKGARIYIQGPSKWTERFGTHPNPSRSHQATIDPTALDHPTDFSIWAVETGLKGDSTRGGTKLGWRPGYGHW